jgi:aspartyl-tRNA(Asn)/glutamyl-tRNA(Gln) amidotransferase subunit B
VRLVRIHLEEDAGKSIHDPALAGDATLVDLNRAGVPLLEIVSEPDMRSAAEAVAYLRTLRQLLRDMEVSDADMERGHFRCDVNVSLRPRGSDALGTRTEIKNLNSFRAVEGALEAEIRRQTNVLDSGGRVEQATMAFDPESGRTRVLRRKENADDYRYFPDPDLVPLVLSESEIEAVRERLPEHADARSARYQSEWRLSEDEARGVLGVSARFFEASVAESGQQLARSLANWMRRDLKRLLNARGVEIEGTALTPRAFATLVGQVEAGHITTASGQQLLPELLDAAADPAQLIRERGLEAVSGGDALARAIDEVMGEHAADVARVRAGEEKVLHFLIGQVMKRTRGKADPQAVRELLAARIAAP